MEDQFNNNVPIIDDIEVKMATSNDEISAKKGRKIDPEVLKKYLTIRNVLVERPGQFTRMELCKKHGVNYHNFSQWISKQKPKEREVRYKPFQPQILGQSVIVTTLDDLINIITPMLKDTIKAAILEGIKQDKIKTMR